MSSPRFYPDGKGRKRRRLALLGCLLLLLAGCDGGKRPQTEPAIRGNGFVFAAAGGWQVARAPRIVSAAPELGGGTLVSVSLFRLVSPYRPALWRSCPVHVLGQRSRQYDLSLSHGSDALKERITFFLYRNQEFQLLCRWRESDGEPAACGLLVRSFKPSGFG